MQLDKLTDRELQRVWQEHCDNIRKATAVQHGESETDKQKRIKHLEKKGNEELWFKYYFPEYCFAEPAPFQTASSRRWLYKRRTRQSRKWCRGMAKSTRRMMEIFYKKFVHRFKVNMLMVSKSEDNAIRLLAPYRANLEANERLINDYGLQRLASSKWADYEFITGDGDSFRAVGAGQNPRGAKLNEMRINIIDMDDLDDDEVCRNTDRLDLIWDWVLKALFPTVEISRDYYIFFDNNVMAEDSLAVRFAKLADDNETINLTDSDGNSNWAKNSKEDIEFMLAGLSFEAIQTEYYNNPMSQGRTFEAETWGKCPDMRTLPYMINYSDPSTSNSDKPGIKSKAQNSTKSCILLGQNGNKFYIYKAFVDHCTNSTFIDWQYFIRNLVANRTALYQYIENNSLQDPFFQQVLIPLIFEKAKDNGGMLSIIGDDRKKPEKWFRIEATLEPLYRMGLLVFNIEEKDDPHMKRLVAQFKSAKASSKALDGPDAVEGAVFKSREKYHLASAGGIRITPRSRKATKHV